jgi:type II pantothenate kinase
MALKHIAIDIGMTNIDLVVEDARGVTMQMLTNRYEKAEEQVREALDALGDRLTPGMALGVTGGRYRDLPDEMDGFCINIVDEMRALGLGGLALAEVESALVVSAGTGTAMVAAREDGVNHVTGSAVGGGTLLGLSKLILGTAEVHEVDHLALLGDAGKVDVMLAEAVGGEIGRLPKEANAVNLGKLVRDVDFAREDLAAGLVRLVAQVIAVIAINAADAESLGEIVMIGHLMDLESIQREVRLVGKFYDRDFTIPENPGFGTAMGVLEMLRRG